MSDGESKRELDSLSLCAVLQRLEKRRKDNELPNQKENTRIESPPSSVPNIIPLLFSMSPGGEKKDNFDDDMEVTLDTFEKKKAGD